MAFFLFSFPSPCKVCKLQLERFNSLPCPSRMSGPLHSWIYTLTPASAMFIPADNLFFLIKETVDKQRMKSGGLQQTPGYPAHCCTTAIRDHLVIALASSPSGWKGHRDWFLHPKLPNFSALKARAKVFMLSLECCSIQKFGNICQVLQALQRENSAEMPWLGILSVVFIKLPVRWGE